MNVSDSSISSMSLIQNGTVSYVRMANLAIVGSCMVNGVAKLHSQIIQRDLFNEFFKIEP